MGGPRLDVVVEAAGGVVWRECRSQVVEVLLIHRPHRQDWSLPKGKRRPRESALECALREVREETGLRCTTGHELPESVVPLYLKGRPSGTRYWSMQERGGSVPSERRGRRDSLAAHRAGG